jgi:hypothetical protein
MRDKKLGPRESQRTSCAYLLLRANRREKEKRTKHREWQTKVIFQANGSILGARATIPARDLLFLIPSHLAQKAGWLKSDSRESTNMSVTCRVGVGVGDMAAQIKVDSHQSLLAAAKKRRRLSCVICEATRHLSGRRRYPHTPLARALPSAASIWRATRAFFV